MNVQRKFLFLTVLSTTILVTSVASCTVLNGTTVNIPVNAGQSNNIQNMNQSNLKNVEVKSDVESLEKLINLPVRPVEVKWTAETLDNSKGAVPGPTDYRLTAVLKYDDQGAKELVRRLETEGAEKSLGNADINSWFPEEVKRAAKTVDDRTLLEGAKYEPDLFIRAPYSSGKLIRVRDTNYFVLNVFSF